MPRSDILLFSAEEWTPFSQRAQSLAIEFARRGNRVFFCEPMLSLGKVAAYFLKGKSLALPDIDQENIYLLRPKLSLSFFRGSPTRALDRLLFRAWISLIKRKYRISEKALIYINLPYWWDNVLSRDVFPKATIIYDCIDDCRVYSRNSRALSIMEKSETGLVRDADLVLATALPLYEKLRPVSKNIHLLSNGVDTTRFIRSDSSRYTFPAELRGLPKPLLGFVGALFHWIDFDAIGRIAAEFRDASVVLVGPTNSDTVRQLAAKFPNIHYLGPQPYERVPDFIHAFDVCLNPFKVDEIGESVNPLKLYEYLCLGKPVVSSSTSEMRNFADYVYLYRNHDELVERIGMAIGEPVDAEERSGRVQFAAENSWPAKVDKIEDFLRGV